MPTYDYLCDACGHRFEEFQSITAKPLKVCPQCGARKVQRLIGTGAGLIFKGSGFYQTDYRSESYKKAAEADKPAAASTGGAAKSTETPAPAKPAAAAAGKAAKPKKDKVSAA
jgi:putative FmdB family regulatory protein